MFGFKPNAHSERVKVEALQQELLSAEAEIARLRNDRREERMKLLKEGGRAFLTLDGKVDTASLSAFDRLMVLRAMHPEGPDAAAEPARIWRKAFAEFPDLVEDLARIGGLYAQRPRTFDHTGVAQPEPVDPYQLAIDQGRREAVLEILAYNLSLAEINSLMEPRNDY